MKISKVYIGYFSPTGGVKKTARLLHAGFAAAGVNCGSFNCLTPAQRQLPPTFSADDVLILCFPVFAGRVPQCLTDWPELQGNGAHAFAAAVYGNRACEDAPREMLDFLKAHGFNIAGYAELVARHSLEPRLGAGRPNDQDEAYLHQLAADIVKEIESDDLTETITFKEMGPYKPYGSWVQPEKISPENCEHCHLCAKICPVHIIDTDGSTAPELKSKCLGCMACVTHCRRHNRALPPAAAKATTEKMNKIYSLNQEPKPNKAVFGSW